MQLNNTISRFLLYLQYKEMMLYKVVLAHFAKVVFEREFFQIHIDDS